MVRGVTNNEVANRLSESADVIRERERLQYEDHLARLNAPRVTIIETATPIWEGAAVDSADDLYDFTYMHLQEMWVRWGIRGQGANVYVLDSGIDDKHFAFLHTEVFKHSFVDGSNSDGFGHGTWVCGKIVGQGVGIAPRCNLTSLKVLDDNGSGTLDASIAALKKVFHDSQANIVNMSMGGSIASPEQEQIINKLADAGVLVVCAAGNLGSETAFYPGSYDRTISVAATDKREAKAEFSNFGGQIDIAAPGVATYSTYLDNKFRKMSGTSMAAPIVTGLLTLGISYLKTVKNLSDRKEISLKVQNALFQTAKDLGEAGKDRTYGYGGINAPMFLDRLSKL